MADTWQNMNGHGVAYYKFEGNANDELGNYNGTLYGSPTFNTSGYDGQSLVFDGTDDYVSFGSPVIPVGKKSIRFKIKIPSGDTSVFVSFDNGTFDVNKTGDIIYVENGYLKWYMQNGSGTRVIGLISSVLINDGVWHDILLTWDGSTTTGAVKIYIDDMTTPNISGTASSSQVGSPSHNLSIGRRNVTNDYYLKGELDLIEIYNEVISVIPNKTLIKSGTSYYYHDGTSWINVGSTPSETDYKTYGHTTEGLEVITEPQWSELSSPSISYWSDYVNQAELPFIIDTPSYTIDEELGVAPTIYEYTDDTNKNKPTVELITEPYSFYDEMGDYFDVLYYTDDANVTAPDLIVTANYTPIDEITTDFEVLTWTNENTSDDPNYDSTKTVARQVDMNALPLGQFVVPINDISLYGDLKQVAVTAISDPVLEHGVIRLLISFDSGTSWETYKDGAWSTVDTSINQNIVDNGMTLSEIGALKNVEFTSKTVNDTIQVSYYLEKDIRNDVNEISKIDKTKITDTVPTETVELKDMAFYIVNTVSTINVTFAGNHLEGNIADADDGKVKYRVFLDNGDGTGYQPYYPSNGTYTDLKPEPLNLDLKIPSDRIGIGKTNKLKVEFEDYWGSYDFWETSFIGTYAGLVFQDLNGNAYATDLGQILKYLDFGILVAGQTSEAVEVNLKNTYGYAVKGLSLKAENHLLPNNIKLELSKDNMTFEETLSYSTTINHDAMVSFYVRLATQLEASAGSGTFKVSAKADKA